MLEEGESTMMTSYRPWCARVKSHRRRASLGRRRPYLPRFENLEDRLAPAILTVTNTNDSGLGSLRQAILDSNASVGVADTIVFKIPCGGVQTIQLLSALPYITDAV